MRRDIDEVWICVLDLIETGFDALHIVHIFHCALLAGGDDKTLLIRHERNLGAFLFRGCDGQRKEHIRFDVDERAKTGVLAEIAASIFVARRSVFDFAHRIKPNERSAHSVAPETRSFHARANGAGFAAMLVHDDLGLLSCRAETAADEVDLGFHDREIILRSALQHKPRTKRGKIRNTCDVEENILGQPCREPGENFLGLPALPLEIYDVGLHEHRTAVAEDRHRLGRKSKVRKVFHLEAESLRRRLEEVAVAGGALRIELKILDAAILENDELDVLAPHIDDDVGIFVELQGGFGVRHGLDERDVRFQNIFQNIFRVARGGDTENFHFCVLLLKLAAKVFEHLDGVLNRIAVRELVGFAEDVAIFVKKNGFRRRGPAIDADETADGLAALEGRRNKFFAAIFLVEGGKFIRALHQTRAAGFGLLFLASEFDVMDELVESLVTTDTIFFALPKFDGTKGGKILSVLRNLDEFFRLRAFGDFDFAFLPHAGNVSLPSLAHPADETVGAAQEQNMRTERVPAGEHAEILQNNCIKQRGHQLIGRRSNLLQAVDVRLSKHPALPRHFVQLDAVIALVPELLGGDFELRVNFVDHRARAAGALIVHRRDFLLAAAFVIILEDDDFGVLSAEFDDRINFRVHLLDGKRDGGNLLHEFRADQISKHTSAGTRHEHAGVVLIDSDLRFDAPQKLERFLGLLGLVPLIVLPPYLV